MTSFRNNAPFALEFTEENDFSKQTPGSLVVPSDSSCPSFTIVSPTPRAFTFPIDTTNMMPYSSSYPRTPSPTSSINSTSSTQYSPSSVYSASPVQSSPKTPHSSLSPLFRTASVERQPKKGDEDYVKRPENAFILFRRHRCEERQRALDEAGAGGRKPRQADLSKSISEEWKSLSASEKVTWESQAKEKKKEHALLHPGYVFRPQRRDKSTGSKVKGKGAKKTPRSARGAGAGTGAYDVESDVEFVPSRSSARLRRRSSSAPPPSSIQLPNLFLPSDSPVDTTFVPLISRGRTLPSNNMYSFDYIPSHQSLNSFGQYILPSSQNGSDPFYTNLLPHQVTLPLSRTATPASENHMAASVHYEVADASYNEHYDSPAYPQQSQDPLSQYHLAAPRYSYEESPPSRQQYGFNPSSPEYESYSSPPSSDGDRQSQYGESSWLHAEDPLSIEDVDHNTLTVNDLRFFEGAFAGASKASELDLHGSVYLELCEDMDMDAEMEEGNEYETHNTESDAARRDREGLWASLSEYEMGTVPM